MSTKNQIILKHMSNNRARVAQSVLHLGWRLDDRGIKVKFPAGAGVFLFSTVSKLTLGGPPVQWVLGDVSLGVKHQGHEADHLLPFSFEVKTDRAVPPLIHMSSRYDA